MMTNKYNKKVTTNFPEKTIQVKDLKVGDVFQQKTYSKIGGGWQIVDLIVNKVVEKGVVAEVYWSSYGARARQGHERLVEEADKDYQLLYRV